MDNDEENLVMPKPSICETAAEAALEIDDHEAALKHGNDAVNLWKMVAGQGSREYQKAAALLDRIKAETA